MKKVLLVGASGFIGSHITQSLKQAGIPVTGAVRHIDRFKNLHTNMNAFQCDFNTCHSTEFWMPHLQDIDVVINAVGILYDTRKNNIENVHYMGPKSLLSACQQANVSRFIHISALGIDSATDASYAITKKRFENLLTSQTQIDWVILKPSMVYGEKGSRGIALLNRLASLPLIVPLLGDGSQQFQPVLVEDLAQIITFLTTYSGEIKQCFDVVGPEVLTMKELLLHLRRKRGKGEPIFIPIPIGLIALATYLSDLFLRGSFISTTYKMMQQPNRGKYQPIVSFSGITPRSIRN